MRDELSVTTSVNGKPITLTTTINYDFENECFYDLKQVISFTIRQGEEILHYFPLDAMQGVALLKMLAWREIELDDAVEELKQIREREEHK